MSNLFDDLEQVLLRSNGLSERESLDDIGEDFEEKDKILFSVSQSLSLSELDVDYSDFKNHVFFGSAYSSANFSLSRIVESYPLDGELKDKNEWKRINTGYENWFFENYPKQQGHLFLQSGSTRVRVDDYESKLNYNSGNVLASFLIEAAIKPYENIEDGNLYPIFSIKSDDDTFGLKTFLSSSSGDKFLVLEILSGTKESISFDYNAHFSRSNFVGFSYDQNNNDLSVYLNGDVVASSSLGSFTGSHFLPNYSVEVGYLNSGSVEYYYSGTIDDLRFWKDSRTKELIKKNFYRTIHANKSGSLSLYLKFNEPEEYSNRIIDYSGNELHGYLTGTFDFAVNIATGTLGAWFKDLGDPILALNNNRVNDFITVQRNSGSVYDDDNSGMIFNLVPEYFIEDDNTEYQQLFLLLTARHFDRLKLYTKHISNILKLKADKFERTPTNLLDLAAKHYGFNLGDIYESSNALQYYFGENIASTGSITSIEKIRENLKRNILSNLVYILKTKSTQESIKSALRSIGLDDNVVTISEYTDFSGGIQTNFTPKTVEQRVANFQTSSNVYLSSSAHNQVGRNIYEVRSLFSTSSVFLTQSILTIEDNETLYYGATVERENLTSSLGRVRIYSKNSTPGYSSITSSWLPMFDNDWVSFAFERDCTRPSASSGIGFYVSSIDRSGVKFSESQYQSNSLLTSSLSGTSIFVGTSGSNYFDGHLHEVRAWKNYKIQDIQEILERRSLDWKSLEVKDVKNDISNLSVYLKLNDFTSSTSGGGPLHDYVSGLSGSSYLGFQTSSNLNFPGKFIDIHEMSHTYDLNVDNDKIRIRNTSEFSSPDINRDIPFISIDFSPVTSLNKEIIKWFGKSENFSNLVGDPVFSYRNELTDLNAVRSAFFRERFNSKIDFSNFYDLIKWFDSNFDQIINQLIPLDVNSSISNFVLEPHILEFNKVQKVAGISSAGGNSNIEATINIRPRLTASSYGQDLGLADPGRYGAFVSASAEISSDVLINYTLSTSSSLGRNFQNREERKVLDKILKNNLDINTADSYINGFMSSIITGSNYEKNVLNTIPNFRVSGVYFSSSGDRGTEYLSSSHGPPTSPFTGAFTGIQDSRWLWMRTSSSVVSENDEYRIDHGIGYGGMWGQLWSRNGKSLRGRPIYPAGTVNDPSKIPFIGESSKEGKLSFSEYITIFNNDTLKTNILWPNSNSYEGAELYLTDVTSSFRDGRTASAFGSPVLIEGYNTLNLQILGRTNPIGGPSNFVALKFEVKFQFFSSETPGDQGFETVMSASIDNAGYEEKAIPRTYSYVTSLIKGTAINFNFNLEKSLPKQKYMRVFITPTSNDGGTDSLGSYFILVKGLFSQQSKEADDLSVRRF